MGAKEILQLALSLPGEDRLHVAEALLTSIEPPDSPPFDAEWLEEARERVARINAGQSRLSSWADVRSRARARLEGNAHG